MNFNLLQKFKDYPKLHVFYYIYVLVFFSLIILVSIYILRFSEYRLIQNDFRLSHDVLYTISNIYYDINYNTNTQKINLLKKELDNKLKDYDIDYKFNEKENSYQLCFNFKTSYNFRKMFNLTLETMNEFRVDYYHRDLVKNIIYQGTNKKDNKYYECYLIKIS